MRLSSLLTLGVVVATLSFAGIPQNPAAQVDPATNAISSATPEVLAGGQAALGVFTLGLSGSCPGPVTVAISGATPGGNVALAWSLTSGSFTIPGGICAGTVLGLASPNVLTILTADAAGNASFTGTAPGAACGAYVQALDFGTCSTSSVENVPVPGGLVFPSASSTLAGAITFLTTESIGYFWNATRGDSVTETFAGAASITSYTFDCDILDNVLNSGGTTDFNVVINGVIVDSFVVDEFMTSISESGSFAAIAGPSYTVSLVLTNDVPGGLGSITMRYAGLGTNALTLN